MKKLSITLVSAIFAFQTAAVAQTIKTTGTKTGKQTTTQQGTTGKTVTITSPPNTQEYSTSHKAPIDAYKTQAQDTTQQGASALNTVEGDTTAKGVKSTVDTTITTGSAGGTTTHTKGTQPKTGSKNKAVKP